MSSRMEAYANFDMEDYWNEYKTVRVRRDELRPSNSDEDCRCQEDEFDSDDAFLEAVLLDRWKEDKEVDESELISSKLYNTLTLRQKAQVLRRAQERNLTIRKKRLKSRGNQKPDVWSVFSATDNSSTGTRSRSATPDSLDSISPPRTPPDPSPKNWVEPHLSRSRASLDSGHHSLIMAPSSFAPISPPSTSPHHLEYQIVTSSGSENKGPKEIKRFLHPEITPSDTYYYTSEDEPNVPSRMVYRAPSLDLLPKNDQISSHPRPKEVLLRRQRSYAKDISKDVKLYYANKGQYECNPRLYYEPEVSEVQGLRYKQIGSLHIKNNKNKEKRDSLEENINPKEQKYPTVIRRSQSTKHHPRDPFDPLNDANSKCDLTLKQETEPFENVTRNSLSTDFGFKILRSDKETEFPDVILEVGRSGQTKVDWLHSNDTAALASLALLELDIIFSENNINHSWRKRHKKRKSKDGEQGVFGVSLESLQEKDKAFYLDPFTESNVPQILQKLIKHLELRGLKDEGILRIPGHRSKTEDLRKYLDENFYEYPQETDESLRKASPNELAALIKLFLRELPQPLLTFTYASAFYKTHRIPSLGERVIALTMLVLLLPPAYRDTLKVILDLCSKVVNSESENKMGLYNVAMIIAPNIFLPNLHPKSKLQIRSEDKEQQLNTEMEYARVTTQLTQVLIKYREIIWTVPNRLIAQVRRQYEASLKPSNFKPIHRLLAKRNKEIIQRPIANEVEYQNGVLRISAPQFNKIYHPVKLDWKMTATDILTSWMRQGCACPVRWLFGMLIRIAGALVIGPASLVARLAEGILVAALAVACWFIQEQTNLVDNPHRVVGRREQQLTKRIVSPSSGVPPNLTISFSQKFPPTVSMTTCLLRGSLKHALDNHALHERGGNITERRIDPNASLIAIYQDNPNGEFVIKCHHPGGQID